LTRGRGFTSGRQGCGGATHLIFSIFSGRLAGDLRLKLRTDDLDKAARLSADGANVLGEFDLLPLLAQVTGS